MIACVLAAGTGRAAEYAAAFLETGMGARGVGMGGAFSALADDPSAPYWNPAGLVRTRGQGFLASLQPLSLDRWQHSLGYALNMRDELAFGFAWQYASAGSITARGADGSRLGQIEDAESAYYVAVARALGKRAAAGFTMKVLDHAIKAPQTGTSTGKGYGFDLGAQFQLDSRTTLAAVARNLGAELKWKVNRSAQQTSRTQDPLSIDLGVGLARRLREGLAVAAEAHRGEEFYMDMGGEWRTAELLTLRAGLNRLFADGPGSPVFGLSLRPMRQDVLQFHYAYAADELEAGNRIAAGLGVKF